MHPIRADAVSELLVLRLRVGAVPVDGRTPVAFDQILRLEAPLDAGIGHALRFGAWNRTCFAFWCIRHQ